MSETTSCVSSVKIIYGRIRVFPKIFVNKETKVIKTQLKSEKWYTLGPLNYIIIKNKFDKSYIYKLRLTFEFN